MKQKLERAPEKMGGRGRKWKHFRKKGGLGPKRCEGVTDKCEGVIEITREHDRKWASVTEKWEIMLEKEGAWQKDGRV